ncbi:MAG: hypothetical protein C4527_09450 [Candidatus Omnitrophota bacterium]|jgi:protein-S-isoprenylcysteine O-methyltransferase Ste14|nr:MAG: hypothetical protein C4527_09450 [Candidatus Omnitrophota bacterium]
MNELIMLGLAWSICCFFHSALITPTWTSFLQMKMGDSFRYYRLAFNLFSLITFIPVFLYWKSLDGETILVWDGIFWYVRYGLLGMAAIFLVGGFISYDGLDFLGMRQVFHPQSTDVKPAIVIRGIHRYVRHPWYAAVLILVWAKDLTRADLLTAVILSAYIFIGTYLEERKLIALFGESYREYRRNVPAFIPFLPPFQSFNRVRSML